MIERCLLLFIAQKQGIVPFCLLAGYVDSSPHRGSRRLNKSTLDTIKNEARDEERRLKKGRIVV